MIPTVKHATYADHSLDLDYHSSMRRYFEIYLHGSLRIERWYLYMRYASGIWGWKSTTYPLLSNFPEMEVLCFSVHSGHHRCCLLLCWREQFRAEMYRETASFNIGVLNEINDCMMGLHQAKEVVDSGASALWAVRVAVDIIQWSSLR